jgi:hypothetical protein
MTQSTTAPVIEYKGYAYTIEIKNDADGYGYPLYHLGSETFISIGQLKRAVDHLVNMQKLGRSDEESLI